MSIVLLLMKSWCYKCYCPNNLQLLCCTKTEIAAFDIDIVVCSFLFRVVQNWCNIWGEQQDLVVALSDRVLFAVLIWCYFMSGNVKCFITVLSPQSLSTSPGDFLALVQILQILTAVHGILEATAQHSSESLKLDHLKNTFCSFHIAKVFS